MDRPQESSSARAADAGPSTAAARGGSGDVEVAVVIPSAGQGAVYRMYEARDLAADGVTLVGGLLLEKNEEVTLEIKRPDHPTMRRRARIADLLPGACMRAAFL